jgi:NTP pyrophosphatase (non-canonical NTP hydrolase)
MEFSAMQVRALRVRDQFERLERAQYGRSWTLEELTLGLVGDMGDLAKLIQAHEGVRHIDAAHERLEHELADVLWSTIIIADRSGVDLPAAFTRTMDELEQLLRDRGPTPAGP